MLKFFEKLELKNQNDSKKIWKVVAPKFFNKTKTVDTIILNENEKIIKNERIVATIFNNYFTDITKDLVLKKSKTICKRGSLTDTIESFNECNSIRKIKEKCGTRSIFYFSYFSEEEVVYAIKIFLTTRHQILGIFLLRF